MSFFFAQWEEYHTGHLPHAAGNFGVTETNYGVALITFANAFIDREFFWKSRLEDITPVVLSEFLPRVIGEMEMRYIFSCLIGVFLSFMISLSIIRVMSHKNVSNTGCRISAISKLCTPLLISLTPLLLPASIIENNTRYLSIATGLLLCLITIKMICFSMAKMAYAVVQVEAIPYFVICTWISIDVNLTKRGGTFILGILTLWYGFRLLKWTNVSINQICARLDIFCFSIKQKVK